MSYISRLFTYLMKKIKLVPGSGAADISVFLSGSLTHHSKDFGFIPVHGAPGCLQHLNLEPSLIFFFKYVKKIIEKYDIFVLQVDLLLLK